MKNSMDKLLREAFGARAGTVPPTPCLDAETAAALADGTLPARERSGADSHVADCLRCQAMLAALARTMPPIAPRVWWRRPAFVWLAPLTAVAAALLVWINIPRHEIVSSTAGREPQIDVLAPPPADMPAAAPEQSQSARGGVAPPPGVAQRAPVSAAPTPAFRAPAAEQDRDRIADQRVADAMTPAPLADRSAAAKAVPPPPAAAERRESESVGQLQARPLPQVAGTPLPSADPAGRGSASAEPAPQASLTETVSVATANVAPQSLVRRLASETVIVSPNFASRWRIGTGGVVQHSADGGATWQTQTTGVSVSLVGGASPSPAVCWLVGPAGIVVVTKDEGRSWQRLPFPTTVDLRSVRATDDKTATVVAADSRTFTTSDGGRTWR
jgi:photosynthesis system II assembly factor YCF48-like protein